MAPRRRLALPPVPDDLKADMANAKADLAVSGHPGAPAILARLQGTREIPQDVPVAALGNFAAFDAEVRTLMVVIGSAAEDGDTSPCGAAAREAACWSRRLASVLGPEHGGPAWTLREQTLVGWARSVEGWANKEDMPGGTVPARRSRQAGHDASAEVVAAGRPLEEAVRRCWRGAKSHPWDSYANLERDLREQMFTHGISRSTLRRLVRRLGLRG